MKIGILEKDRWFSQKADNGYLGEGIFLGSFFEALTSKYEVYHIGIEDALERCDVDLLFCCIDPIRFYEDREKLLKLSEDNIIIGFSDMVESYLSCDLDQYICWSGIWRPVLSGFLDFADISLFDLPTWKGFFLANVDIEEIYSQHANICTLAFVLRPSDCHLQLTTLATISLNNFNSTAYSFEAEFSRFKMLEQYIPGLEVRPHTTGDAHYDHIKECYAVVQLSPIRAWGTATIKCLKLGKPSITSETVWQKQLYPGLIVHSHEELSEKLSYGDYTEYIKQARYLYNTRYKMSTNHYRACDLVEKIYAECRKK